jgi:hypothetical protein
MVNGWSKGRIVDGNITYDYISKNISRSLDVWTWKKGQLHYPETSVILYDGNTTIVKKHFKTKSEAKKYAKVLMIRTFIMDK